MLLVSPDLIKSIDLFLHQSHVAPATWTHERKNLAFGPVVMPRQRVDIIFKHCKTLLQLVDKKCHYIKGRAEMFAALRASGVDLNVQRRDELGHFSVDLANRSSQ